MKMPSRLTLFLLFLLLLVLLLVFPLLAFLRSCAHTIHSDILQDVCAADINSDVKVNGYVCKPSPATKNTDFSSMALSTPSGAATTTTMGSLLTASDVEAMPGLNTLGISMSRTDFTSGGLSPPHAHPRATEMVFVLSGQLDVGFIVASTNKLVSKTITTGEVFVFPRGLVHFMINSGTDIAGVISAYDSQLPGDEFTATTLFAAAPAVADGILADGILAMAFGLGAEEVEEIKSRFIPKVN